MNISLGHCCQINTNSPYKTLEISTEWSIHRRFKSLLIGEIYLDLSQWHTSVLSAFWLTGNTLMTVCWVPKQFGTCVHSCARSSRQSGSIIRTDANDSEGAFACPRPE